MTDLQPFSVDNRNCDTEIRMMAKQSEESYIREAARLEEGGHLLVRLLAAAVANSD